MTTVEVLYLGLVCWLATTVIVESVLFAPARVSVQRWAVRHGRPRRGGRRPSWRDSLAYLVGCHLCTGIWVGLAIALVAGGPFDQPLVGWALSGLTYKAIGHLVLEVVRLAARLGHHPEAHLGRLGS